MRLTCPNCGAQYEVPAEVIPEGGRDVQCSNCGITWFQHHPDHASVPDEDESDPDWDAPGTSEIEDAELVEGAPSAQSEPDQEPEPDPSETPQPERRTLDSSVAEVLRSEAERERAARAAETGSGLETQPELGLGAATPRATAQEAPLSDEERRSSEAQARLARLRGEPSGAEEPAEEGPDPGTRRNLLPDIDEINSSLDSDSRDPGMIETAQGAMTTESTGGFRRGFLSVVLLAVIGLLLYMFAPLLGQAVPALDGVMSGYVGLIDTARAWLDGVVSGFTGQAGGAEPPEG